LKSERNRRCRENNIINTYQGPRGDVGKQGKPKPNERADRRRKKTGSKKSEWPYLKQGYTKQEISFADGNRASGGLPHEKKMGCREGFRKEGGEKQRTIKPRASREVRLTSDGKLGLRNRKKEVQKRREGPVARSMGGRAN